MNGGDNHETEYRGSSGEGSDISYNVYTYVPFLKNFIKSHNIKNIVDLGCGDFKCGGLIYDDIDISYTGYDAYRDVITHHSKHYPSPKYTFIDLDIYSNKESIIDGDLCILKDVLQHWLMTEIYTFMDYLVENSKFKYILICNCGDQTQDDPDNAERSTPLSADFFPLKKYNVKKLYNYKTKEISIIDLSSFDRDTTDNV
jgi:hypothetical protein